jgi:hypothetical protein
LAKFERHATFDDDHAKVIPTSAHFRSNNKGHLAGRETVTVLCRFPVGLVPFADEAREDPSGFSQVGMGDG